MGKIIDVKVVEYEYEDRFANQVMGVVSRMQEKGLDVEIQYSTTNVGTYRSIRHSAMIIGKSTIVEKG